MCVLRDPADKVTILDTNRLQSALSYPAQLPFNRAPSAERLQNIRVYRVERVNGPWLWLAAEKEGAAGWAKVENVIPYDHAIDYISSEIRANPTYFLYNRRGLIWGERKEYDIAIADYNEAIRLDPRSEVAYCNRGNAWHDKEEYDRAVADNDEAIRLDPKYGYAYTGRAATYLATSREITLADVRGWLDAAGWRGELAPYIALLGHFALRRARHDDEARRLLDETATKGDTSGWPYPAIRYLRKEIDGKALLAAASDRDKMARE